MAKHKDYQWWPKQKRTEVVAAYLVVGKAPMVEVLTGVPASTIRQWKTQPWWKELVDEIQVEEDQELDAKIAKTVTKVLDVVNDRLDNGDFQYDPRTAKFVRKPVGFRDAWRGGKEMIDLRQNLRKAPKERVNQEAVKDILVNLAREFAQMAQVRKPVTIDVTDVEIIDGPVTSEEINAISP